MLDNKYHSYLSHLMLGLMLTADQSSVIDKFSSSLPCPVVLMHAVNTEIALLIYTFPFFFGLSLHFKKKNIVSFIFISDPTCCLAHNRF